MSSGESRLVQGSNGSLSVPVDTVAMDSVKIEYPDYGIGAFYHYVSSLDSSSEATESRRSILCSTDIVN